MPAQGGPAPHQHGNLHSQMPPPHGGPRPPFYNHGHIHDQGMFVCIYLT